jgi:hypothetical protein
MPPLNSYVNDLRGFTSSTKLFDVLTGNIMIANYGSQGAIDNDDSSGFYQALGNVLAYGQMGMKSDFGKLSRRAARGCLACAKTDP